MLLNSTVPLNVKLINLNGLKYSISLFVTKEATTHMGPKKSPVPTSSEPMEFILSGKILTGFFSFSLLI